jgi:hypothetical protein
MKMHTLLPVIPAVMLLGASGAQAAPVYEGTYVDMYLQQNTFPDGLEEEMVFLDPGTSATVTGHVGSQTDPRLVNFTSTTDSLVAASGFATINAEDGIINDVTISAPGYWFEDVIFSVNMTPNATADLTVTATDNSGATDTFANWTTLDDWVNGENRILVLANEGNLMQSVTISSQGGLEVGGIDQIKETELSGVTPIPEPETYAMLLAGLGLVGAAAARRKRS